MNLDDSNDKRKFFYSKDGEDWIPLSEVTEVHVTLSEEQAAKMYALMDPLEIVPNAR